jgi:hypothetical protein
MHDTLEEEVRRVIASMDNEQTSQEQEPTGNTEQQEQPDKTIHIHYYPDAIVITPDPTFGNTEEASNIVDTTLAVTTTNISEVEQLAAPPPTLTPLAYFTAIISVGLYLFLIFSCIAFQVYEILNPPIATVTIIPKSQQVTLTGTLQLGRVLQPLTISQSQTTPTTGKGHQDARSATGFITFYNGQLNSVTVAAGTILTGSSGVQIITDQDAYIPAESQTIPPTLGQTTISAHALLLGTKGNIPTGDINQGCCAPSVLAQNTTSFHGGLNERDYQTVSKGDISSVATPLKTTVIQSMRGALQGQVKESEQLFILPCTPTVISYHQPGAEATQVKVTVSQTCSAVAYNSQELERKAADLLNRQAVTKAGTGYSLFGEVRVTVTQTTVTHTTTPLVFLSFQARGTWVYALSNHEQQRIKSLISGKSKQAASRIIASLPGVERVVISWGDDTRLPKNSSYIHFVIFINAV